MKTTIAVVLLLCTALMVSAAAQAASGKELFVSKCATCPGADGSAKTTIGKNLKIRDFHSPEVQKQSDLDLKATISNGKGKMPAFQGKLSGEQIDQLVSFIRELGKQK
jgi:mono/diheme cytochrome c family protein